VHQEDRPAAAVVDEVDGVVAIVEDLSIEGQLFLKPRRQRRRRFELRGHGVRVHGQANRRSSRAARRTIRCHPERATLHAETGGAAGRESRDPLLQESAGMAAYLRLRGIPRLGRRTASLGMTVNRAVWRMQESALIGRATLNNVGTFMTIICLAIGPIIVKGGKPPAAAMCGPRFVVRRISGSARRRRCFTAAKGRQ